MKILQVMAGNKHGGAETAFVDMCLAMAEAGQDIEVVTRSNAGRVPPLQKQGIKVHTLPFGGRVDIFTPWKMTKIIKTFQPDIVQTWMARAPSKTPRWHAGMNIPRYQVVSRLGGYYKLKYFKNTDYFITITPDIKRHLMDHGVEGNKIRAINNFAETEKVETPLNRSDYGTPGDAPLLLGLGRLHPSKAFDTLIKVAAQIPQAHLWIAGEGPQRAELEKLIKDLNIADRVKLLGWRDDRAALLGAADICVFSSRYEPFGTVFVQAWAEKTPLVTTDADGPRQFVRDEQDGLIVPVDDENAMKQAIERLINDPELASKLVENGTKRFMKGFTKEKTVAAYLDWFEAIKASQPLVEAA